MGLLKSGISLKKNFKNERQFYRLAKLLEECLKNQNNFSSTTKLSSLLQILYDKTNNPDAENTLKECLNKKTLEQVYIDQNEKYRLSFHDGLFYTNDHQLANGKYLYVHLANNATANGDNPAAEEELNILVSNVNAEDHVKHHSFLANGKKVFSAGYLKFNKGKLWLISNESGHYCPDNNAMLPEIIEFFNLINKSNNAKKQSFIYEDNSKCPTENQIYLYDAKEVIDHEKLEETKPVGRLDSKSNFGREPKINDPFLFFKCENNAVIPIVKFNEAEYEEKENNYSY